MSIYYLSIALALAMIFGAFIGGALINILVGSLLAGVVGFGVAALLYLVVEELIKEAYEVRDKPWITALFFLGFLIILIVDKAILE